MKCYPSNIAVRRATNAINATYLGWVLPTRTFFADVGKERKWNYARSSSQRHVPHSGEESTSGGVPGLKQCGKLRYLREVCRLNEQAHQDRPHPQQYSHYIG
jgi:hypothetical protein